MAAAAVVSRAYVVDDAFTGFLYVDNLLAGKGFVFYPGQAPVEGVTNVGWLGFLLPLAAAIGPIWAAKVLGCALVIVAIAMVMRLGQTLAEPARTGPPTSDSRLPTPSSGLAVVPAVLLAMSFEFVYFSLAGMETALLAVILLGMALAASRRPGSMALPVLARRFPGPPGSGDGLSALPGNRLDAGGHLSTRAAGRCGEKGTGTICAKHRAPTAGSSGRSGI